MAISDDLAGVQGLGDINGDGHADAMVAFQNEIQVYNGDAFGLMRRSAQALESPPYYTMLEARGDFNDDGIADLVTVGDTFSAQISFGTKNGLPTLFDVEIAATEARSVFAEDVDCDGVDDVVFGRRGPPAAGGTIGPPIATAYSFSLETGHSAKLLGSVTGDGVDMFETIYNLGDVNGDGCGDVLIAGRSWDTGVLPSPDGRLVLGDSSGFGLNSAWSSVQAGLGEILSAVGLGDVDRDGFGDVLFVVAPDPPGIFPDSVDLLVLRGTSTGLSGEATWRFSSSADGWATPRLVTGDINGDGHLDVVIRGSVYLTDGTNTPPGPFGGAAPAMELDGWVFLGDVNGDGCDDLLARNNGKGRSVLYAGGSHDP